MGDTQDAMDEYAGQCAFPVAYRLFDETTLINHGLTKRELFAAMAMQGLLAARDVMEDDLEDCAEAAVIAADALLAALRAKEET
jgi:hypothetical protein